MHEAEVPGERIHNSIPETIPGASDGLVDATVGAKNAVLSHLALLFCQPAGVVRPVGENKVGNNSNDNGDGTLDEEEPLPRVQAG